MPLPSCRRRWQQYQAHQLQPHCCTILLPFAASSPLPAAPSVPQRPALSTSSKATPLTAPSAAATAAPSSSPSAAPPTAPALLQFQQHHRLSLQHLHSVQHRRLRYPPRECCTTRLTDCAVADCLYHALWPERRVGSKNALSPFSTPLCLFSRKSQILLLLSLPFSLPTSNVCLICSNFIVSLLFFFIPFLNSSVCALLSTFYFFIS